MSIHRLSRSFVAASGVLLLLSIGLLVGSLLPFDWWKTQMDHLAVDGNADSFTSQRYSALVHSVRAAAFGLVAIAVLTFALRDRLADWLQVVVSEISAAIRELGAEFAGFLQSESRWHLGVAALLLLWGVVVRVEHLSVPVRQDEAYTFINYVSKPLWIGLTHYDSPNNHFLNTGLSHLTWRIFGLHPWALRLPALVAGCLVMPMFYATVRRTVGPTAAMLALGLAVAAPELVKYASNSRGYSIVLLAFLALWFLADRVIRGAGLGYWVLFAAWSVVGFLSIPIMLYPFGTVAVWLILRNRLGRSSTTFRKISFGVSFAALCCLIAYIPALVVNGVGELAGNEYVRPLAWDAFVAALPKRATHVWTLWNQSVPVIAALAIALGFLVGTILRWRRTLALSALLWCGPLLVIQRVDPFARIWLFLLPLYWQTALVGWTAILTRLPWGQRLRSVCGGGLAMLLCGWMSFDLLTERPVYGTRESGYPIDAESITAFLLGELETGDRVLPSSRIGAACLYYGDLVGLPRHYFFEDLIPAQRVFVITASTMSWEETLQTLSLENDRGELYELRNLRVLREFDRYYSATVFEARLGRIGPN